MLVNALLLLRSKNAGKYPSALTFLENYWTIIDKSVHNKLRRNTFKKKGQTSDYIKDLLDMLCELYGINHCHQHLTSALFLDWKKMLSGLVKLSIVTNLNSVQC